LVGLLLGHFLSGQLAQLLIDQRQQLLRRRRFALLNPTQHLGYFTHGGEIITGLLAQREGLRQQPANERVAYPVASLVETNNRIVLVVGQHVGLDHVFHAPDKLGVGVISWRSRSPHSTPLRRRRRRRPRTRPSCCRPGPHGKDRSIPPIPVNG